MVSRSECTLEDFSAFGLTALLERLETDQLACAVEPREVLMPDSITGSEVFGMTAGIKSSGLDCNCFLEEFSLFRTGLDDLRSTFTLLVPLSTIDLE